MITKNNAESVIRTMNQSLNASVSSSGKRNLHILNVTWVVLSASTITSSDGRIDEKSISTLERYDMP